MRAHNRWELLWVNAYWPSLSFMWNTLHAILLPAVLLTFVDYARKNTALGLMTFAGLMIALVVQPISGAISDVWVSRFGRRRPLILIGTALDLIFLAMIGTADGLGALTLGYVGLQFTSNLAHGPAQGLMHDRISPERMGLASGVKNFLDMAGLVVSSLVAGRLLSPEDPQPLGLVTLVAGLMILGAAATAGGVREDPAPPTSMQFAQRLRGALRTDLRANTHYWRLIWGRLLFLLGVYGVQAFAQYYVRDVLHPANPIQLTGDLLATIVLSLIAFSILTGYLCDRIGRKPLHVAAAILTALGSLLMLLADSAGQVLAFGSIIGAGIGVFITANWALANDLAPRGEAGKFLGLTNLATAGSGAISRLTGPGIDWLNALRPGGNLGYSALFAGAAALALLSLLALRRIPDRAGRRARRRPHRRLPIPEVTMSNPFVECIPNFSEGRRTEVIESIEASIRAVPGVQVLDRHTDADHNRSVITFAGPPRPVSQAAFAAIARAAELIDLDKHQGQHPRIGATDVVPFVPLSGITLPECVDLARGLGERVGRELGIPVYLYEAAATRPDRVNLENHRRGEYEGLKESIGRDPDRAPDFGPAKLGKAGATVIGARAPLIAYNVYLTTDDVEIARKIARAIRNSSGGFRYLKALGLLVEGRAQVSMNFTDFTQTALHRVVEQIRREADRHGAAIHHSELVGLIPQAALIDTARWYLQLDQFQPDQVLETRLASAAGPETSGEAAFLERLSEGSATPGGGSAAAYAGAMAAALVGMVARLTIGKAKFAAAEPRMREIAADADAHRARLHQAVAADAGAFEAVMAARRLPKGNEAEQRARAAALEATMRRAAEVPLGVAQEATSVLELAVEAAEAGNPNAASDAGSAGALAQAALTAAAMNVRVNAASVSDRAMAATWLRALSELDARAAAAQTRLARALRERLASA